MKKINLFCIAAMLISAAACTEELKTEVLVAPSQDGQTTFYATIADTPGTKLTLDNSNGKLYWERGDGIGIFTEATGTNGAWFRYEGDDYVSTAAFTGTLDPAPEAGEYIYGIHPYFDNYGAIATGVQNGKASVFLTNGYHSARGLEGEMITGFKGIPGLLPGYGDAFPMVARSKDYNLHFYNVCGGLTVTVNTPGLIGVIIKNNDGSPLWGVMEVAFDADGKPVVENISLPDSFYEASGESKEDLSLDEVWIMDAGGDYDYFLSPGEPYYAVLPPVTFTQGLTVTYRTASTSATYTIPGPIEIKRSQFSRLTLRDAELQFTPLEGNIQFSSEGFKAYCVANFDTNGDGEISYAEALEVKSIYINGTAATDAPSGYDIIYFENLESFVCRGTANDRGPIQHFSNDWLPKLRQLDLTYNNVNGHVNVRSNPELETLILQYNSVSNLSLGNLPKLTALALSYNELSSIDLSGCPELQTLYLAANQLQSLDLSANPKLDFVNCGRNTIGSLDLSANTLLTYVACPECGMSSLNLKGLSSLVTLYCYQNQFTSLDLSDCTELKLLSCYYNNLSSIDLTPLTQLTHAYVSYNPIGTLDVSKNTALQILFCCINKLSSLDVSNLASLDRLRCFGNDLQSLDLSHNPVLNELIFGGNPMMELDVSNNPNLYYFDAIYDEYWNDHQPAYNTYSSPLQYLYVAEDQQIPEVTYDRLDNTIPFGTIVGTRAAIEAAGHPHADLFGDYTFGALIDRSSSELLQYTEWDASMEEYKGNVTRVWINGLFYMCAAYPDDFEYPTRIFAFVSGDGNRICMGMPATNVTTMIDGNETYYFSAYRWNGALGVNNGGRMYADEHSPVLFIRQNDGSFAAHESFGFTYDIDTYSQGVWYGSVNFADENNPMTLTKKP